MIWKQLSKRGTTQRTWEVESLRFAATSTYLQPYLAYIYPRAAVLSAFAREPLACGVFN